MAKISIEITDCKEHERVEVVLVSDTCIPEDRNTWTPAQKLASLVRAALQERFPEAFNDSEDEK